MKKHIIKLIDDTLRNKSKKWSIKRLFAFSAYHTAIAYEVFLPILEVQTKEYVFITLITFVGAVVGITTFDKKDRKDPDLDVIE